LNTQKQIVLIVALLFIFTGGCAAYTAIELPVRAPDQQKWTEEQSLERGALLFANNCRTCHGNKGEGSIGPVLNDPKFQDQDPLVLAANRALIRRTLYCGRASTLMPAWLNTNGGSLNAIQIEHLVNLITAPAEQDETGASISHWWDEAEHFAEVLNHEVTALVGGDTLNTIARAHGIGPSQLAAFNNMPEFGTIKKGTEIKIPPFAGDPNGYTYTVYKDSETMAKIADSQFVGATIIADLNGLAYDFSEKRGVATMQLKTDTGADVAGVFPGQSLKLPAGSFYIVTAGDTIEAIATKHSLSANAFVSLNSAVLSGLAPDDEVPFERRLTLPKLTAIVQEGQTLGTVAALHDLTVEELAAANQLGVEDVVAAGTTLTLPSGTRYVVQSGDTWELVGRTHGSTAAEIAQANNGDTGVPLTPDVVLQMPAIDAYIVQGQSLEQVADGYANVTAASLAAANSSDAQTLDAETVLAVGTQLKLPDDAYGSAPPDAKNPGTACVQYAVPSNVFEELSGARTPATKPANLSNTVTVAANSNDFTFTADGQALPANNGVVLVSRGTTIPFTGVVGIHTVTVNGEDTPGGDLEVGDVRQVQFNDAGEFEITCVYHPAMLGYVFVD